MALAASQEVALKKNNPNTSRAEITALVAAWQDKVGTKSKPCLRLVKPSAPSVPSLETFVEELGYDSNELGWAGSLAENFSHLEELKLYLSRADGKTREDACKKIVSAVKDEFDYFAMGLAENPSSERFSFVIQAQRLQELHGLASDEDLSAVVESAFDSFDRELQARHQNLKTRLKWQPKPNPNRVDGKVRANDYKPGQPHWLSGRLNDAPTMLGKKLTLDEAERAAISLEKALARFLGKSNVPRPTWTDVSTDNTYFAQGQEPRVQFGQLKGAPGVEGYLKKAPEDGPRVLEFPMGDGRFEYLMFDGHHRSAAQLMRGLSQFRKVTVMRLGSVEQEFGLSKQDILDAIRDLHKHLYMTDRPVPR